MPALNFSNFFEVLLFIGCLNQSVEFVLRLSAVDGLFGETRGVSRFFAISPMKSAAAAFITTNERASSRRLLQALRE